MEFVVKGYVFLILWFKPFLELFAAKYHHLRPDSALSSAAISAASAFAGYKTDELYAKHTDKTGRRVNPHMGYQGRNGRVLERSG